MGRNIELWDPACIACAACVLGGRAKNGHFSLIATIVWPRRSTFPAFSYSYSAVGGTRTRTRFTRFPFEYEYKYEYEYHFIEYEYEQCTHVGGD
jgi:hypothetical protein